MPAYLVIADSGVTGSKQAVHHVSTPARTHHRPTTKETGSDAVHRLALSNETKRPSNEDPQTRATDERKS